MSVARVEARPASEWPAFPIDALHASLPALHRWVQMVGKTRLALSPPEPHWWHTALYVTARGLGTSPIPAGAREFEIEFDFIDHVLRARVSDGQTAAIPLAPGSVAGFYGRYRAMLAALDVRVRMWPRPSEMSEATRFDDDTVNRAYEPDAVHQCWRAVASADRVLKVFRGRYLGRSSPVHFWWGAFDLACTRFSGRPAPPHPGGFPNLPDWVTREAYSRECISAGWWPGGPEGPVREPTFYAYAYPEPSGCPQAVVQPDAAEYHPVLHEWVMPYESVRQAHDPDACALQFLQSTWEAAADLGGWDRAALERRPAG